MEMGLNETLNSSFSIFCQYFPEDPLCWSNGPLPTFKLTPGKIISAIGIAVLMFVALSGNILVCTAFFVYQRLRKTTNYFIISLALSDILVATVAMPMWLSYEVTAWYKLPRWIDFFMLLRFWNWLDILAGVSSITNLTAISIDRCLSIRMPLLHRTRMTNKIAIIMVLFAWIYSIVLASLSLAQFKYFTAVVATLGFFFPLLIIVVSYSMIYFQVKGGGYSEQDWNLERTLIIVISVFVICWLPFFIFAVLYHYCFSCHFNPNELPYIISFIKWMHYLNSCCNPFIYGLFNLNFKNAFRGLLRHCFVLPRSESEGTLKGTSGPQISLKCQLMGLKRTLKLNRKSRDGSFISSDADNGSTCLTVTTGHTCNIRPLQHDILNGIEDKSKVLIGAYAEMNGNQLHGATNPVSSEDLSPVHHYCESQDDSPAMSFLQSQGSQESRV